MRAKAFNIDTHKGVSRVHYTRNQAKRVYYMVSVLRKLGVNHSGHITRPLAQMASAAIRSNNGAILLGFPPVPSRFSRGVDPVYNFDNNVWNDAIVLGVDEFIDKYAYPTSITCKYFNACDEVLSVLFPQ